MYECPVVCARDRKEHDDFCAACPVGKEKRVFRKGLEKALSEINENWQKYGFDNLCSNVYEVGGLRKTGRKRWTVKFATMVDILDSELSRRKRIKAFNDKQKPTA